MSNTYSIIWVKHVIVMLKVRLISLRVPFMKMVALPSGIQRCIHGPAVNVPSKVDTICLPVCLQRQIIPLKLKCKLAYRGHYMYDYISPEKVHVDSSNNNIMVITKPIVC
jgi:hypothetical protein